MKIQPAIPPHRRQDPGRCTVARVYGQLAGSDLPGHVLYELKPLPEAPGVDFAVWIEGMGRFGIQFKGGRYSVDGTIWTLRTNQGGSTSPPPSP